jgi:hypothetical protein
MKVNLEKRAPGNALNAIGFNLVVKLLLATYLIVGLNVNSFAQIELALKTEKVKEAYINIGYSAPTYSDITPNNLELLIQENLANVVTEETDLTIKLYFTLDAAGKVLNISSHGIYSSKLQRSLANLTNVMPNWQPATFNGAAIPSKVIVPVKFKSVIARIGE